MIIPWQSLEAETLIQILESFILREGTDYGEYEQTLENKVAALKSQLVSNKIQIIWSELSETIDIKEVIHSKSNLA